MMHILEKSIKASLFFAAVHKNRDNKVDKSDFAFTAS